MADVEHSIGPACEGPKRIYRALETFRQALVTCHISNGFSYPLTALAYLADILPEDLNAGGYLLVKKPSPVTRSHQTRA